MRSVRVPDAVAASVAGAKHRAAGRPSQDAVRIAANASVCVAAVADGVSSAPHSEAGAQVAVATASDHVLQHHRDEVDLLALARSMVLAAREAVLARAGELDAAAHDLACTMSFAIADTDEVLVGCIGDGTQAVRYADATIALVAMDVDKEVGRYTRTLVTSDLGSALRTHRLRVDDLDALLLSTDGLEDLLWTGAYSRPVPQSDAIHGLLDATRLQGWGRAEFERMLRSPGVAQLTDDDLSLVVVNVRGAVTGQGARLRRGGELAAGPRMTWPGGRRAHQCLQGGGLVLVDARGLDPDLVERALREQAPVPHDGDLAWPLDLAGDGGRDALVVRPWSGRPARGNALGIAAAEIVRALHEHGYAHGALEDEMFAQDAYGRVQLRDCITLLAPGDPSERMKADLRFVARHGDATGS